MIEREDRDHVAILRMQHGKANAIDPDLFADLDTRLDELEAEENPRAVVLTGTGSMFSAGVDLFKVVEGGAPYLELLLGKLGTTVERLFSWPHPVVVAVNGHAIAGGCVLAAAGDHRVMTSSERTRIGVSELMVGVPFPTAAFEVMRYRVPLHVEELVFSGRLLDAREAHDRRLVEELVDPEAVLDRACEVAAAYGAIPAATFAMTKAHLRRPTVERIAQIAPELDPQVLRQWSKPESLAGIRRFLEATVGKK